MSGLRLKKPGKWRARLYKTGPGRVDWKHRETGEAAAVVKGTNRRVVVVRSPDPKIFEEAIFVIREDLFHQGTSADKVLAEARQAAGAYLRRTTGTPKRGLLSRIPAALYAGLGAAVAGIAWLAFRFVGV